MFLQIQYNLRQLKCSRKKSLLFLKHFQCKICKPSDMGKILLPCKTQDTLNINFKLKKERERERDTILAILLCYH